MTRKCQEIIVQFIVKAYNDADLPVGEVTSQPIKLFRGQDIPDIWAFADNAIKQTEPKES